MLQIAKVAARNHTFQQLMIFESTEKDASKITSPSEDTRTVNLNLTVKSATA